MAFGLGFVDRREYAYPRSIARARGRCVNYGILVSQAPYCTHETDSNSWLYNTVSIGSPPREHSVVPCRVRLDLPRPLLKYVHFTFLCFSGSSASLPLFGTRADLLSFRLFALISNGCQPLKAMIWWGLSTIWTSCVIVLRFFPPCSSHCRLSITSTLPVPLSGSAFLNSVTYAVPERNCQPRIRYRLKIWRSVANLSSWGFW